MLSSLSNRRYSSDFILKPVVASRYILLRLCTSSKVSVSLYVHMTSGVFENIMDSELPMFSGIDLDQVSDWVDEHIYQINKVIYKD